MIARYDVTCTGCGEGIRLRISVGTEERQSFYLRCPQCSSVLRGALMTDQEAEAFTGLEIDGQPAIPCEASDDFVVNVFSDMPVDPAPVPMLVHGGSPFMMHQTNLGDAYDAWAGSRSQFLSLCRTDWANVRRWWGFYIRQDWQRFDDHAQKYWSDEWPEEPSLLQRHDAIHRALEVLFVPLFPRGQYVRWKKTIRAGMTEGSVKHLAMNARSLLGETGAARQDQLFSILERYVELRWALLPGLLLEYYIAAGKEPDPAWRITRDEYPELRDLYVSLFGHSHRQLPLVFGFANAMAGRPPSGFPDGTVRRSSKLEQAKAYKKGALLKDFARWGNELAEHLDRDLRNAIGHADAHHDLENGRVAVGQGVSVPYSEFVLLVARSVQVPLLCLDTIKMLRLFAAAGAGAAPDGAGRAPAERERPG